MEALAVIWAPVRTLSRVAEERRVLLAFVVVALYAALGLIEIVLAVFFFFPQLPSGAPWLPPGFEDLLSLIEVFSLIYAVTYPFVWWLLVSGLMHLVTRFFGGTGPFSGTLAIVGIAQMPFVINTVLGFPIAALQILLLPEGLTLENFEATSPVVTAVGWLNPLLGLAFLLWHAALVVIGAAFARRVGYGESASSCAISCTGCLGLIILTFVVIVVVFAVFTGALDSARPA